MRLGDATDGAEATSGPARVEGLLQRALETRVGAECPPRLAQAIRHAVLAGGNRLRPRLCLAVAEALGSGPNLAAEAAAVALEFLHCASLVHDDLPCFDDAHTRRGAPSVHRAFGEALAVLAGDALIVAAFEVLAAAGGPEAGRLAGWAARAAGVPHGITAGQAWEAEPVIELARYHTAKTGALFEAAAAMGAAAAGGEPERWRELGARLGAAYQVADDIRDAVGDPARLGKPVGQDDQHGRPNAVRELGLAAARERLERLGEQAQAAIPECPGRAGLSAFVRSLLERFRQA